jgi:cytoskeletal protein RodZ
VIISIKGNINYQKGSSMKNMIKLIGILLITVAVVFSVAACKKNAPPTLHVAPYVEEASEPEPPPEPAPAATTPAATTPAATTTTTTTTTTPAATTTTPAETTPAASTTLTPTSGTGLTPTDNTATPSQSGLGTLQEGLKSLQ